MEVTNINKKVAEAVVDAAILSHWVNDGVYISEQTRDVWIEAVMNTPEITEELFKRTVPNAPKW